MPQQFGSAFDLAHLTTPSATPAANRALLYFKSDGKLYAKSSAGVETLIGPSAGGGGATVLDDLTDVNAPAPGIGNVLRWDYVAGEWNAWYPTQWPVTPFPASSAGSNAWTSFYGAWVSGTSPGDGYPEAEGGQLLTVNSPYTGLPWQLIVTGVIGSEKLWMRRGYSAGNAFGAWRQVFPTQWADIGSKPATYASDWNTTANKPATFTPTVQALDWLSDVATAGQATNNVLTFNGSSWVPTAIPAQDWSVITGKPSTFAPVPQALDWLTDVATAGQTTGQVLSYNGTTWVPATAYPEVGYAQVTSNLSVTATTSATSQLVVALGAITYTAVPHEVEMFSPFVVTASTAGAQVHLGLYDGSASAPLGRFTVRNPTAAANGWPMLGKLRFTPSAGSHTYQMRAYTSTTGATISAGAGGGDVLVPAYIKITRL